jgi:hypothetical protein
LFSITWTWVVTIGLGVDGGQRNRVRGSQACAVEDSREVGVVAVADAVVERHELPLLDGREAVEGIVAIEFETASVIQGEDGLGRDWGGLEFSVEVIR